MSNLPLIVGFGGVNAAGRSSCHHAFRRMIIESVASSDRDETIIGLAVMMNLLSWDNQYSAWLSKDGQHFKSAEQAAKLVFEEVIEGTLIREIDTEYFDVDNVPSKTKIKLSNSENSFVISKKKLPKKLPASWRVKELSDDSLLITVLGEIDALVDSTRVSDVRSAGQLPKGFDPGKLYNSRFHPKGLQLAVMAVADAINSLGISWQSISDHISPDEISVYASSCVPQLDDNGLAGILQSRLKGERVTSKQLALSMNTMPADFVNAYVCGNVGGTGSISGACATFLYNLKLGCEDIRQGKSRVVIVGTSEAPITPEVIEGFDAMGAVARQSKLEKLDGGKTNLRQSSRPFGENCGFTIAESAQYTVLMDDALALELGLEIHGAIGDVFVNADGYKKSISSPGVGNYITMSKAVSAAIAIAGKEAVTKRSFIHSHGSSTPQNRVTESVIMNDVAKAFDIENWPLTAVKSYLGHPLGPASGDQLVATLGTFKYKILPGIKTVDSIADDVDQEKINIALKDLDVDGKCDVAFLNSKGFGGNNASAVILSPDCAMKILKKRYSDSKIQKYKEKAQETRRLVNAYDQAFTRGDYRTIYSFGESVVSESDIQISRDKIEIKGFNKSINLKYKSPYS